MARYESEHRSDRVRRALEQNAERGIHHGGPRPYGWSGDGTLNPAEAAVVAELTRRVVGGESLRALAADLRERGIPSSRGAAWEATAVRGILLRPRNAGLTQLRGEVVGEAIWPAIVDRNMWEACRAVLTDPTRRTAPGNTYKRLLSGLMTCGVCDAPVRAGGSKGGVPTYRCSTGKHVKRRVALVDDAVETFFLDWLSQHDVSVQPVPDERPDVREQADALRLRLAQLEDKYADGDLSREGYRRNRDRLSGQLDELERQEALTRLPSPLDGVTVESWPALPLERRRAALAEVMTIQLLPTGGNPHHDPKLIKITPKRRAAAA